MHQPTSAITRIAALKEEIAQLQERAITELKEKRLQISIELHEVDSEIARLTGKPLGVPGRRTRAAIVGKTPSLAELKDLLSVVPGKTLNLRKEGLDAKHIKGLAVANTGVFKLGGKGARPEITLVK
jgi:hypothetical protein